MVAHTLALLRTELSPQLLEVRQPATATVAYFVFFSGGSSEAMRYMPNDTQFIYSMRLAEVLGYDRKLNTLDYPVSPRGYRILGRIPRLPRIVVSNIVRAFGGLDEMLAATDSELEAVEGVGEIRAKDIREGLRRLQEINLVDRYLQT